MNRGLGPGRDAAAGRPVAAPALLRLAGPGPAPRPAVVWRSREGGRDHGRDALRRPFPAEAEVDAVLQARAVHGLIGNDPRMPPKLRTLLVLYAGDPLDRDERNVELTPSGLAALAAAGEAGPRAAAPAPLDGARRSPGSTSPAAGRLRTSRPPT